MAKELEIAKREMGALYDVDFYEWTRATAAMIREGRLEETDLEHIAEEIESLGNRDPREVESRLVVLLTHLLKWEHQRERRSRWWRATIIEQRRKLNLVLRDSPSLRRFAAQGLASMYAQAVEDTREETGLSRDVFAEQCPYSLIELLERGLPD